MKPLDRNISILEHIIGYCYGTVDPEITWDILTENILRSDYRRSRA